ncbi:NAD(P)-dependent oxidoreductase [Tractidigestivibacter sp.]|uniref:NAD(P)-dependent oxidoreductase n=1 Tax=Tractidigestivibacter sp. TaxID=2847320 RepID=UPI003FD77268
MARHKIAVCNTSTFGRVFPEHLERLARLGDVVDVHVDGDCHGEELSRAVAGADIIITSGTPQFDAEFFDLNPQVKLVARDGLGFNNVDVEAANAIGAYVTKVEKPVEREAVAELTVALLMDMVRSIEKAHAAANDGRWLDRGSFIGHELLGMTVGIIGCGNIGTRVAEILRLGFGMRVLANDPIEDRQWASSVGVTYVDLDTIAAESDVITTHATLNPTSYHLIGADFLSKVKKGVYIIDTARGDIVDQDAMIAALECDCVRSFGIDAVSVEPPAPDDPYLNNPKVIVTPHIGAYTRQALKGMGEKVVRDAELVAAGKEPTNIVCHGKSDD